MSEKIYSLLLHLYPSDFREVYGEEALQLFRDRARDENGFFSSLRLWLDLLADLIFSVSREHLHIQPRFIAASAHARPNGAPFLFVLETEPLPLGPLLFGIVLTLSAIGAFSVVLDHAGNHSAPFTAWSEPPTTPATGTQPGDATPQHPAIVISRSEEKPINAEERQRVLNAVVANLKAHYFDHYVAQKMSDALLAHANRGDDNAPTDREVFAALLTKQARDVSQDMHLEVIYSRDTLPDHSPVSTPESLARYHQAMEQSNCTFEKVQLLPHNIGYLKLNSFPDASFCQPTAVAAMATLNHADALIFDLRDNRGGFPNMVSLLASYLFDYPEYIYNPRESPSVQSWTASPILGNQLADKPVYILISSSSWSGAEQFTYDLKMLKRATLVGETTRGAAHAGVFYRLDDHFGMGIPEVKSINPFSKSDWEGVGIEPHIKVNATNALATALKLAEGKLPKK